MIIDADSHVCEPPDTWTSRMPSKWGDLIPRIKHNEELGADLWYNEFPTAYFSRRTIVRWSDGRVRHGVRAHNSIMMPALSIGLMANVAGASPGPSSIPRFRKWALARSRSPTAKTMDRIPSP